MNLSDIRKIVITQAIEESDSEGRLLFDGEKRLADAAAGAPLPSGTGKAKQNEFLAERGNRLIGTVESRLEGDQAWLRASSFRSKFTLFASITVVVAAVIGYLTNELDPKGQINLLKFPLIGIMCWNLLVYLIELFVIFRKDGASKGISGLICRALFPPPVHLKKGRVGAWDRVSGPITVSEPLASSQSSTDLRKDKIAPSFHGPDPCRVSHFGDVRQRSRQGIQCGLGKHLH